MSANGHTGDVGWFAKGFEQASLNVHYGKHKKEFPGLSKTQYNNLAVDFMNSSDSQFIESFIDANGTIHKYDELENLFGMATKDGTLITFFKPTAKKNYWEKDKEANNYASLF